MATHKDWDKYTNGSEVANTFADSVKDKNIVITGVSPKSLGETLVTVLASHSPANLILASRTASKLEAVANAVREINPECVVKVVVLDLSSQKSVRTAAAEISSLVDHIDLLINNAAVMTPHHKRTAEGIELQFGTGHIGHFLLTTELLPLLTKAAKSAPSGAVRVVNVTSQGHRLSPVRFHDYNFEGKDVPDEENPPSWVPEHFQTKPGKTYSGFLAYGQVKTANILFSLGLTGRFEKEGIRSFAVHPGSIHTDLSRNLSPEDEAIIENTAGFWSSHDQGTSTILVAALDPALNTSSGGVFLSDCQVIDAMPHASDPKAAERLWGLSEELIDGKGANAFL